MDMANPLKIGVSCGGTGGHIFPGLVTAQALQARGHGVTLWLAGKDVEGASVTGWSGPVLTVRAEGLPATMSPAGAGAALRLLRAVLNCRRLMAKDRPDVLLAMGSYASVGPVLAARWHRVPVVLHEANVLPGRAIAFLSRFAARVATGFPETAAHLPRHAAAGRPGAIACTGMPIRPRDARALPGEAPSPDRLTVLIMGGSQGAHALNDCATESIIRLHRDGLPIHAIHLTGRADRDDVADRYRAAGVPHHVFDFLLQMDAAYRAAHLAVCRSGASTCAELAAHGLPAILVPYPTAIHGHQLANARALQAAGAARVLEQSELDADRLTARIRALAGDATAREAMSAAARARAAPDAAHRLAALVESAALPSGGA